MNHHGKVANGCADIANRTSVFSFTSEVWCYDFDGSHNLAWYLDRGLNFTTTPSCDDFYVPSQTHPGIHFLCKTNPRSGRCYADKSRPWGA